jgi:hypothetical protein
LRAPDLRFFPTGFFRNPKARISPLQTRRKMVKMKEIGMVGTRCLRILLAPAASG